jgi:hypothetical protein
VAGRVQVHDLEYQVAAAAEHSDVRLSQSDSSHNLCAFTELRERCTTYECPHLSLARRGEAPDVLSFSQRMDRCARMSCAGEIDPNERVTTRGQPRRPTVDHMADNELIAEDRPELDLPRHCRTAATRACGPSQRSSQRDRSKKM